MNAPTLLSRTRALAGRVGLSTRAVVLCLFFGLFALYHANFSVVDEGDCDPSINLPLAVLKYGKLSFDAEHFPQMFKWFGKRPLVETDDFYFLAWNWRFGERSAGEWHEAGKLVLNQPRYFIVESPKQHALVSTFGPIPAAFVLPIMAVVNALDPLVIEKPLLKLAVGKLTASLLVAGTTALLFAIALRYTSRARALLVALSYGVASCAWAISSQNIWQQSVNQFLLVCGAYFFLGPVERRRTAAWAGFFFGAAVACRATGAIVVACVLVWLVRHRRQSVLAFLLGAAPVPVLVGAYNFHFFGSPFTFAQELVGHALALEKTGKAALWQTPLMKGLAGLLFSPSRGLALFSPHLLLGFWGAERILRDRRANPQKPLVIAVAILMLLQCKWFDWWGGWAYGYRPWLDVVPFLTLFTLPALEVVLTRRAARVALAAALGWAVFVQALGAFAYDRGWNKRRLYVVQVPDAPRPLGLTSEAEARALADERGGKYFGESLCDVDYKFCRYRLWSVNDSIIPYYVDRFSIARKRRWPWGWGELGKTEPWQP